MRDSEDAYENRNPNISKKNRAIQIQKEYDQYN